MNDATHMHAPALPIFAKLRFERNTIRAARHPIHGRLMMAKDVVEAIGYTVKSYTAFTLNGLKVSEANRITLTREDFDASEGRLVPTFDQATFLTRAGLDELVANAAAKKVRTFGPWMTDVMKNGVRKNSPQTPKLAPKAPEPPPEGLPWED